MLVAELAQVSLGPEEMLPQDVAVHRRPEELSGVHVPPGPLRGQHPPQIAGGDLRDLGQVDDRRAGGKGLAQVLALLVKHLLAVLQAAGKGRHPGVLEDAFRLVPVLHGEEHVRAHEQPQLVLRELLVQLLHGVGRVALSLPAQLQVGGLCAGA